MFFRKKETPKKPKSALRGWIDAAVFAVVVITPFRTFCFEAYNIPTGSMEGSMLIGDRLYVNKMAYGARIPMTPLAVPLVHNSLPLTGGKSYTDAVQWKYRRLPGFGKVERDDIVVFNTPSGDTAIAGSESMDYYQACRMYGREAVLATYDVVTHPVDKRENLIKRCVGIPGDKLELHNGILYVNGKKAIEYPHSKMNYIVKTNGMAPSVDEDMELLQADNGIYAYNLANDEAAQMKVASNVVSVEPYIHYGAGVVPTHPGEWTFPFDTVNNKWNADNYGPITIPKAGTTVALNTSNIALYRRIIGNYEGNKLEERNGKIYINDKEANSYTFKMDYYWMMGDNRHNSLDSRYWGFVPEDHIVGKASFVWFSMGDDGPLDIRWERLLRSIKSIQM
jgi:signal peptidase I